MAEMNELLDGERDAFDVCPANSESVAYVASNTKKKGGEGDVLIIMSRESRLK